MKIRVLHVIGSLKTGGAETALVRLCKATQNQELDHEVLALGPIGPLERELQDAGIPALHLFDPASPFCSRAVWRPHVIQGWMYHGNLVALALRATLFPGAALAWNIRCGLDTPRQYRRSTRGLIRVLAALSRTPEAIIYNAVSARASHEAAGYVGKRGEVISNGFDLRSFHPDPISRKELRAELGLQEGEQLLGLVARFHPEKNPGLFLRALSHLPTQVHGLMAGPGMATENPELANQIQTLRLRGRVHLLGERLDMPRIMAGLDLAVSTSWNEGFSNTLGEAQACGVPCVATDVGDSAVLVGGIGRVVSPGDEMALSDAIRFMLALSGEARTALGDRARARMAECYAIHAMAGHYQDLYGRLADRL